MVKYLFIILFLTCSVVSAEEVLLSDQDHSVSVLSSTLEQTRLEVRIGSFSKEQVFIDGHGYYTLGLDHEGELFEVGKPALPVLHRSIIIPFGAEVEVHVREARYTDFHLPVAPARGLISQEYELADVPFEFGPAYQVPGWYPEQIVRLGSPYILRNYRGVRISIYPLRYNPKSNSLRVYTHLILDIELQRCDQSSQLSIGQGKVNYFFEDLYRNHFLNYGHLRYPQLNEKGRLLIISHGSFLTAIQPYVDWKRQKGIQTDVYDVAQCGTTAEEIKNFIQIQYDAGDGLTFVQFVGDEAQIPTFLIARDFCAGDASSDPTYALLDGTDSYPEIFVGRFSAQSVAEVETQVTRTIHYERDLDSGEWLHKGTGLGSAWGEGYGYNGWRDRELVEAVRQLLLSYTYTEVDPLYELGNPPFGIIPVPKQDFIDPINEGRSIVNIQGHADCAASMQVPPGDPTQDLLTIPDVQALTNDYMLPFMFIGAPYLGHFQETLTLPEAWLRTTNSSTGAPVGAIAVYASSVDLDYASPQAAQYEANTLLVNDTMQSIGGLFYNGTCYAIDLYAERGEKTFLSYNVLGDITLQVRTDTPQSLNVTHEPTIDVGQTEFVVDAGVAEALVCLSENYSLVNSEYTALNGVVILTFPAFTQPTDLTLTVTASNKITCIETIPVTGEVPLLGWTGIFTVLLCLTLLLVRERIGLTPSGGSGNPCKWELRKLDH